MFLIKTTVQFALAIIQIYSKLTSIETVYGATYLSLLDGFITFIQNELKNWETRAPFLLYQ